MILRTSRINITPCCTSSIRSVDIPSIRCYRCILSSVQCFSCGSPLQCCLRGYSQSGSGPLPGSKARTAGGMPHDTRGTAVLRGPRSPRGGARAVVSVEDQLQAAKLEIQQLKDELVQVRLQLFDAQRETSSFTRQCVERLATQDIAAHRAATEVRYTAMALDMSLSSLEVELRRVLSIGLTPDEVDIAAVEAGARQYLRLNVGYRAERVAQEAPVAVNLGESIMVPNGDTVGPPCP